MNILPYRRAAEIAAAPDAGQLPWLTLLTLRVSRQCDPQCHTTFQALALGCWQAQQLRLQGHNVLSKACLAQDKIAKIRSNFYFELQFILRRTIATSGSTHNAAQAMLKWPKLRTVAELLQVATVLGWIWLVLDDLIWDCFAHQGRPFWICAGCHACCPATQSSSWRVTEDGEAGH